MIFAHLNFSLWIQNAEPFSLFSLGHPFSRFAQSRRNFPFFRPPSEYSSLHLSLEYLSAYTFLLPARRGISAHGSSTPLDETDRVFGHRLGEAQSLTSVHGYPSSRSHPRLLVSLSSLESTISELILGFFSSLPLPSRRLSLWTVDEPYLPLVHGTIINILRSLSSSSSTTDRALADLAQALQQDQRRRTQRHRSPLQTPESLITEALSKELVCTCTLDAMLIAAKNTGKSPPSCRLFNF